jgi:hypothetical protein
LWPFGAERCAEANEQLRKNVTVRNFQDSFGQGLVIWLFTIHINRHSTAELKYQQIYCGGRGRSGDGVLDMMSKNFMIDKGAG